LKAEQNTSVSSRIWLHLGIHVWDHVGVC